MTRRILIIQRKTEEKYIKFLYLYTCLQFVIQINSTTTTTT